MPRLFGPGSCLPQTNGRCSGLDLKEGTSVIGGYYLGISIFSTPVLIYTLVKILNGNMDPEAHYTTTELGVAEVVISAYLILFLLTSITAIQLLHGVIKGKAKHLRPFLAMLVIQAVVYIMFFIMVLMAFILPENGWNPLDKSTSYTKICWMIVSTYCILTIKCDLPYVNSLYTELLEENSGEIPVGYQTI